MTDQPLIVLYDAECRLCQGAKRRMEDVDKTQALKFVPLQDPWRKDNLPPHIRDADLRLSMHVVRPDGQVFKGAASYREIGRVISPASWQGVLLRLFSIVVMVPGMLALAEVFYKIVANNRYRWFKSKPYCETDPCSLE